MSRTKTHTLTKTFTAKKMDKKNEDKKSQKDIFIETARELNCNEDRDKFDSLLKKIVSKKISKTDKSK